MRNLSSIYALLLIFLCGNVSVQKAIASATQPKTNSHTLTLPAGMTTKAATGVKASKTNMPTEGKYYFLTNAFEGFETKQSVTKSIYVEGTTVKWGTTDYDNINMYWQIFEDGGKYVFRNVGTQLYMSSYSNNTLSVSATPASDIDFNWASENVCYISIARQRMHCGGHNNGAGVSSNIIPLGTADAGASQWYIMEVESPSYTILKKRLENRVNELNSYTGQKLGINPGQYSLVSGTTESVTTAIANANSVLEGGSTTNADYENALSTLANISYVKNPMLVGQYYRIQSTTRSTYTSIEYKSDGGSQMRNSALNETDPRQIWKLEQEGEGNNAKYYLVNLASGLYPQQIVSGGGNTSSVGAKNPQYSYSWEINTEATTEAMPTFNIKFGGTQVNVEENGNVNYWYADNAHHYLWKVQCTEDELSELVNTWLVEQGMANGTEAVKIALTDNATQVISPSEYAAPAVVNAGIDALKTYAEAKTQGTATIAQAQAAYQGYKVVDIYKKASDNYGAALSASYTLKAQYGTMILPINYVIPTNVKLYTCNGENNGLLTLTESTDDQRKNLPYIVEYTDEATMPTPDAPKIYQFIGYANGAATTNQSRGWLTGVLEDNQYVPDGSYILAKHNDKLGFYQVDGANVMTAAKYKCYLTVPVQSTSQKAFYFNVNDVTTAINAIFNGAHDGKTEIYDLSGKRLSHLQKGINIVNGQKVMVR